MNTMAIRAEAPGDEAAIAALTNAAFKVAPHAGGNEAEIIRDLRGAGDLALSLVAENMDRAIIGHIAFSPVTISDGTGDWYGLAPVSVIPLNQSNGIGSALINRGLADLRGLGGTGCVLLGDPAYYGRFGFEVDASLTYAGGPPQYFQRLVLEGVCPAGAVHYAPAFGPELGPELN